MDKLQKVINEVERLQNELITEKKKGFGSDVDDACILELQNIKNYIKFVQEEPVSEDLGKAAEQDVCEVINCCSAIDIPNDHIPSWVQDAMVNEFIHGANWKEQKMMANAIDGKVIANGMGNPILHLWDKGRHLIDKKVKVIVIEEE